MGFFSKFERRVEDGFDEMGDKFFDAPISPVQIAKKAEKQMRREKMVGAGKEYAPTLYTVLVNPDDDELSVWPITPLWQAETERICVARRRTGSCNGWFSPGALHHRRRAEAWQVRRGSRIGFRPHRLAASRRRNAALRPFRAGCRRSHSRKYPYTPELRQQQAYAPCRKPLPRRSNLLARALT